jgi:hypothetical protein
MEDQKKQTPVIVYVPAELEKDLADYQATYRKFAGKKMSRASIIAKMAILGQIDLRNEIEEMRAQMIENIKI